MLVVVIDTEEEFDWSAPFDPARTTVANIAEQGRAQAVFDAHGVVPTYVVDYPVATTPAAVATLGAFQAAGRCEIGAHLHPWVTPPDDGVRPIEPWRSYPGNLPEAQEAAKLAALTEAIKNSFGISPVVYKAGRYGIGPATLPLLAGLGYRVDVSVVPHTDFSADGGPDFRGLPAEPLMLAPGVVELPLSVHFVGLMAGFGSTLQSIPARGVASRLHLAGVASRLGLLERLRLSPEGYVLADLERQTQAAFAAGTRVFMLTYHSSALLPGATAYVGDTAGRDRFVATIDAYLRFFLGTLGGRTSTAAQLAAELAAL
ncbi:MAG: glycosyltransferase [Rhodospirillales bacterium]|nr:glycosyltransferase [Rhodospirillales bacterium]